MQDGTADIRGQACRVTAAGEPDDGQRPSGAQELPHPLQSLPHVHVVEGGNRGDEVEGSLKGIGEKVTGGKVDLAGRVLFPGQAQARLIEVDGRDMRDGLAQLAGEDALAAADIKSTVASIGDR